MEESVDMKEALMVLIHCAERGAGLQFRNNTEHRISSIAELQLDLNLESHGYANIQ